MDLVITSLDSIYSLVLEKIVPFLFVLTIIVFVHEMGHFLVARWCGVKVETFSIGFGREIFGFTDRKSTRWKLCWIPLGGYVKFAGDMSAASTPDREAIAGMSEGEKDNSFHNKNLAQRAAVVVAGPVANFILSIAIFALTVMLIGRVVTMPLVDDVRVGSAADEAGFQVGDMIKSIDGEKIKEFSDLQRIVSTGGGAKLVFEVERNGKLVTLNATPKYEESDDGFGNKVRRALLGISRKNGEDRVVEKYGPLRALQYGVDQTWFIVTSTFSYLYGIIAGREDASQLGGPIKIAEVSGQVATFGFAALMNWAALLSVSIGLINLFPIPMLDGGHLMYYAIEAVRGKPLSAKMQDFGFRMGMALVLMLMLFATYNDIRPKIDIF